MQTVPTIQVDDPPGDGNAVERFVRLRWIAATIAATCLVTAKVVYPTLSIAPALVIAGLIAASNVGHVALGHRPGIPVRTRLLVQFLGDIVLLAALLATLGGVGPLLALLLFHVVLAGVMLQRRDALLVYVAAVAVCVAMGAAQFLDAPFPDSDAGIYVAALGTAWSAAARPMLSVVFPALFALIAGVTLFLILPIVEEGRAGAAEVSAARREAVHKTLALESMLDSLGAAMIVVDASHVTRWVNRVAREWFPSIQVGAERKCRAPGGGPCPTCHVLAGAPRWSGDYTYQNGGGGPRVLRIHATRTIDPDGATLVVELVLDVTEERDAVQRLPEARKHEAIARFASGVAHELHTPLASMAAGLRTARRQWERAGGASSAVGPILATVAEETERCRRITESVLAFARGLRSELEATEVNAIVRSAIARLPQHRQIAGIEIVAEGAPSSLTAVYCDATQLDVVLVNVLTNAVDSIRARGGADGRIRVKIAGLPDEGAVELVVRDNGRGLEPLVQDRVFEPFFTTKEVGEGTGLGLAVARGLLEGMGGSIRIAGMPERGAEVVVRLRAAPPGPLSVPPAADSTGAAATEGPP